VARALAVIAIVLVGGALRVTGIGFGDPFVYHPDEWIIAGPAMTMAATGDWNPHNFFYPSLLIDLEAFVAWAVHALGGATLATGQPWLFENELVADQFGYVLAGRLIVAILGTATIVVVFETTRRLVGVAGALAAAAIMAVIPLAVEHSHYLTTDVPMTFMCAACLLATVVASQDGRRRWWLFAALLAGLAGSTKWNGLAVALVPFVAYVAIRFDGTRPLAIIRDPVPYLMVAATLVGFIVPTPAILLAPAEVASFVSFSADLYAIPDPRQTQDTIGFNISSLVAALGPLLVWCAVGLVVLAAWVRRDPARRGAVAIPVFIVVYFVLASLPARYYARNLLPLIPFLAVAGGVAVGEVVEWLGRQAWLSRLPSRSGVAIVALAVAVSLAIPVPSSLAVTMDLLRPDTRDIARAWMLDNVPRETVVAREIYTPVFDDQEFTAAGRFFLHQVDLDGYRAAGARYLIASSWSYERFIDKPGTPREDAFYKSLFALPEVFRVDAGLERNGPTIRIFRLD
jgi:4-amino-4-deoxy-L-arabinose transferase-like glycosyltransferase